MSIRDPVCGKRINRNKAHITIAYRGEAYYLCCPQCQSMFERDPERYVRAPAKPPRTRRAGEPSGG
ncbi:MAG: YHS domain-containing protein [Gemmatimonadales bacterium]|nr:YHS domain-containing protein [Gemmatimonadales bacterium]NIN12076.1 YHS domain-containing protein [Gemmatimonadales bacterium]NIR03311.1 YHS domain-containing protein [Gemmatimonadales bacterium]NIS66991.1 YHS domain-containing protein [Gemmatimonadales bacterium]